MSGHFSSSNVTGLNLLCFTTFLVASCVTDAYGQDESTKANAEVWRFLPSAKSGGGVPLPSWARAMAKVVPRSTAALLELDLAQRTASPIDPKLRSAMRWVAADANRCDYAKQAAALDAKLAGLEDAKLKALDNADFPGWSDSERKALAFAHKMTVASSTVTDGEFAAIVDAFGDRQAASMVLLTAYANMQDRLLLCLRCDAAADAASGALAPVAVSFGPDAYVIEKRHPRVTESTGLSGETNSDTVSDDGNWSSLTYETLQSRLQVQRGKPTRLPVPEWDKVAVNVPEGFFNRPSDIVWYRIVFGYAPELAVPFERFMRTSGAETSESYGRIYGTTLFWIVTRAVECPYCMGHCEMNWEVAGLDLDQIAERSRALAADNWSAFSPEEQRGLAFARKLSLKPWEVSAVDFKTLQTTFGDDLALTMAMHISRYHYMTRISNGFQLTLEDENVFFDYWNKPRLTDGAQSKESKPFVGILSDSDTWALLPKLASGEHRPLPNWVKAVATQLPRTAAAMLELDAVHRLHSPISPSLRAKQRWVIAHANQCPYSESYALADLRVAGATESEVQQLVGDRSQWPEEEQDALEFALQLTTSAASLPDGLFERVQKQYGDNTVAAMVLLGAYGNFQDRIVLGLNLPIESNGPLRPLTVTFAEGALQRASVLPLRNGKAIYRDEPQAVTPRDEKWMSVTYDQLQTRLESQRTRQPRLPIPAWDEVKVKLPSVMTTRPTQIAWSLVNYGYAHELAIPWTTATRTHWAECPSERILEESLFWVQTRAIQCNYCMGHCEMLLEVAGLQADEIANRTRLLAESDWSSFPISEQHAYSFARKLTLTPWAMNVRDFRTLEQTFGKKQAMSIFWWLCRGLYMTRISDGFQLPLERVNVFE